jgi:hypothetical protein
MRRLALAAALLVAACSSKSDAPPAAGSASGYQALGKKPANARRPTAPPGIEAKALAVGTKVPAVDALSKHARVMLVFYRGDW